MVHTLVAQHVVCIARRPPRCMRAVMYAVRAPDALVLEQQTAQNHTAHIKVPQVSIGSVNYVSES